MLAPLVKSLDRFTMILNLNRISFSKLAIAKKRTGPINQAPPPKKKELQMTIIVLSIQPFGLIELRFLLIHNSSRLHHTNF